MPDILKKLTKQKIDLKKIFRAFDKLQKLHDIVIVEGVGGVMAPILKDYFVADLIKDMEIPALIVSRSLVTSSNLPRRLLLSWARRAPSARAVSRADSKANRWSFHVAA